MKPKHPPSVNSCGEPNLGPGGGAPGRKPILAGRIASIAVQGRAAPGHDAAHWGAIDCPGSIGPRTPSAKLHSSSEPAPVPKFQTALTQPSGRGNFPS